MQHKWHKEIKAWADGAEIEYFDDDIGEWRNCTNHAIWYEDDKYRIKPQPKEPQYLYVYQEGNKIHLGLAGMAIEVKSKYLIPEFIAKIKLEVDDV